MRRFGLEAITIIGAAIIVAFLANVFADRDRKVALIADDGLSGRRVASSDPTLPSSIQEQTPAPSPTGSAEPLDTAPSEQMSAAPTVSREEMLQRFPPTEQQPFVNISPDDARWLHGQGRVFLDARRTSEYEAGHIAGARNFAVWEADVNDKVQAFAEEGHDPDLPIVIYCSGGDCQDSQMLAQKLWGLFYNNLVVYEDGYPDWVSNGGPVRSGPNP